jgi:hypothetical protein
MDEPKFGLAPERPTRVYDEWKWHFRGAFPAGTPARQAYVHIGMYLTWIILRDLENESFFTELERLVGRSLLQPIRDRRRLATSLREVTDGVLASDMLSPAGQSFTEAYYDSDPSGYLRDWGDVFGDAADSYAVPDDWDSFASIETVIDAHFASWSAANRADVTE